MSNTRFAFTNLIEASGVVLKNGTGGGAPARDEVTGYEMENAMRPDRWSLWKLSGGASLAVDFDLTGGASNKSIGMAGLLGHRPTTSAGLGITSCDVYGATNAAGYAPGPWTPLGTINMAGAPRDGWISWVAASYRYVRFDITCFDNFTLGRFWIGVVDSDLGAIYAPGSTRETDLPKVVNYGAGGAPFVSYLGDQRYLWSLQWQKADATLRNKIVALAQKKQSLLYLDHNDAVAEVFAGLRSNQSDSHVWNNPALYDNLTLDLFQLG